MLTNEEIRTKLMDATVRVVSADGLEGASTRRIGEEAGINGTCIYRYFINRDDLLMRTYSRENAQLCKALSECIAEAKQNGLNHRETIGKMWEALLNWMLLHPDSCRMSRYYFNSSRFSECVLDEHLLALDGQMRGLADVIPDETQREAYVYMVFDLAFSLAMRALNTNMEPEKMKLMSDYSVEMLTSVIK